MLINIQGTIKYMTKWWGAFTYSLKKQTNNKTYLGVVCNLRLRGLPNRGSSGVKDDGNMAGCPFVLDTSQCGEPMHTCRLQTFDPITDFSVRKHSSNGKTEDFYQYLCSPSDGISGLWEIPGKCIFSKVWEIFLDYKTFSYLYIDIHHTNFM